VNDWRALAACRGRDGRLWFPARTDGFARDVAKSVCAACPVRADCLAAALSAPFDVAGIWGGTTEHERDVMTGARRARECLESAYEVR
jgi:WhiB family redox-sensing transcriptional regulator